MSATPGALAAEAAAGLSTRWAVLRKHEATYTDAAAKVTLTHAGGTRKRCEVACKHAFTMEVRELRTPRCAQWNLCSRLRSHVRLPSAVRSD